MRFNIVLHDKYKRPAPQTVREKQVCIHCAKERYVDTPVIKYKGRIIKPNTNTKMLQGWLGPTPGSFLGCILGVHDFYFKRELEHADKD